jgi:hydroxyacylglutathione hydrolase
VELDGSRALFTGDTLFFNGLIGLINAPGAEMSAYRRFLPRLADLSVDMLLPGHGLFVMHEGQAHIDRALSAIQRSMLPPTIGMLQV